MAVATEVNKKRRVIVLSAFLFLQMLLPFFDANAAGLANFQIFAQSTGAGSIVSASRVEGGVKLTYAQSKVYAYSVGRYSTPSFNDSDLTYQSGLNYGANASLPLLATKISCDASFNIRLYNASKAKIATVKLIIYNTANGPCTNEKLAQEMGENQIKDTGGDGGNDGNDGEKGDDGSGTPEKEPESSDGDGDKCDACAVFECPKWDTYMGKIDDIIEKIPPAPDWNKIIGKAETPVVEDFQTPTKPATPDQPTGKSIFDVLDGVDEKNQDTPKMKDNSDEIGDFESLDDVKAPKEEKDESGGFKIVDPLDNLSDGSDAPRPKDETISPPMPNDETVPTPTPSDENISPPMPNDDSVSNPVPSDTQVSNPVPNDTTLEGPTTDDTLQNPTTDDYLEYPTLSGGGG